jgi:hypothetical protein
VKRFVGFLLFAVMATDWGAEYAAHLGSPLGFLHDLLLEPYVIPIRPFDLIMAGVLIAALSKRDARGFIPPMRSALLILVGVTIFSFAWGLFHGGDARAASWQTYLILSAVLVSFTVAAVFRAPADYHGLAKWLLAAVCYRALMCWISYFTWGRDLTGVSGAYLTTHDDSIGWVVAIMALIVNAIDRRSALVTARNLALMLFIAGAIQFNSRRLAWVSLAMGVVFMYFLFPKGVAKRRINRALIVAMPIVLLYVAVGWGREERIFLPLRSFATVSTKEDASTLARNAENLGLVATANAWGFGLGSGWGKPYIQLSNKYDISGAFELWQYVPHNSVLGLLAFTGVLGSAAFWLAVATGVYMNARIARLASDPVARSVGIIGAAQVVVCANQLYGDMGIFFIKPMYFLAISYGIALRMPRQLGLWAVPGRPIAVNPLGAATAPMPGAPTAPTGGAPVPGGPMPRSDTAWRS